MATQAAVHRTMMYGMFQEMAGKDFRGHNRFGQWMFGVGHDTLGILWYTMHLSKFTIDSKFQLNKWIEKWWPMSYARSKIQCCMGSKSALMIPVSQPSVVPTIRISTLDCFYSYLFESSKEVSDICDALISHSQFSSMMFSVVDWLSRSGQVNSVCATELIIFPALFL